MSDADATQGVAGTTPVPGPGGLAVEDELAPGARIGEYVVQRLLAAGGHGSVYLAEHRVLGRRAALKVMHRRLVSSSEMVARFVREARVVNQIRHPNIVDIYDLGTLPDGRPYCVMELLPGENLGHLMRGRGRLSPAEALAFLGPVCEALEAAHRAGVIHRDVKASNIAVVDAGDPPRVKLLDFGVAKVTEPGQAGLTTAGQRLGTTQSMAPEQIRGEAVDLRTDVYALGVLLHQLLTGQPPFRSEDPLALERMHLDAPPPRPSQVAPVPPALDAVVARCLAKRPADRFASVAEFAAALREAVGAESPSAGQWNARAVAIHVAVGADETADDEGLVAQAVVLEALEQALQAAGFTFPLATASVILAVRPLPDDAAQAREQRAQALALAGGLAELARRSSGTQALGLQVCAHVDVAWFRAGPQGPEAVGGPLCHTSAWVVESPGGFYATTAAEEGISAPASS
jgi:tRNA A-37 threonylcarbamoyl transferase component Bud32